MAAWFLAGGLAVLLAGCRPTAGRGGVPVVASTTSYLEAAARDLLGQDLPVLRLAEPGTCPGHFDLRPSQVEQLRRCRLLLRFDFQQGLDAKLAGAGADGPRVGEISIPGGMGLPASYLAACRQAAEHLVVAGLLTGAEVESRLEAIAARIEALAAQATNRVAQAGLAGTPVLASGRQREFCQWLGLRVVGEFGAADTASIGQIEEAIAAGKLAQVRLVIANLPEGRRTAEALAERLQARVVVFENFPALRHGRVSFDAMLSANVAALLAAGR